MPIANLSQRIAEISEELENLRAQSLSHPEKAAEILRHGLEQFQVSLKELTALVGGMTEAERAEEVLRESEARFRCIAKAGRIGLFEWNASKDNAYWSPEHYELLGYEPGSPVSWQRWFQGLHPEDRERVEANALQLLERARSEGGVSGHKDEYRFIRPDSSVVWIEANLSVDMVGGETIVRGSVCDITERKRAEEALNKSEKQLKHIIENSTDVAYRRDLRTDRFDYISPVIENITGFSVDEMMAMSTEDIVDRVHPDDLDTVYKKFETTLKGSHCVIEYRFRCKDGNYRWIADAINILADSHGNPIYRIGVARDITERKRAEESEERLKALLDHNPSLVFLKDESGKYVYLNKAYERQFALSKDWHGKTDFDFWPKESAELFRINDSYVLKSGQTHQFLEDSTDLEGIRHCWLCYKFPFVDSKNERYVGGIGIDATDRMRAEEALRLAYTRLQTFFDQRIGGIGIVIANAKGNILQANDYYLSILGCTREELLSGQVDWRKMTPPEWLPADERALAQLKERGVCDTYEKEYERRDGTRVPVLINDAMMPGDSGDILAFVLDITERKKVEEMLQESEERYRGVVQNTTAIILRIDPQGVIRFANERALEFFGYSSEELIGKHAVGTIVPEQETTGRDLAAMVDEISKNPDGFHSNANENMRKNGERMWMEWTNSGIYDADGRLMEFLSVGIDATERKKAEQALAESEARYRRIIETAEEGIATHEPDGTITYVNQRMADMLGYSREEIIGRSSLDFVDDEEREKVNRARESLKEEGSFSKERKMRRKDGSILWTLANVSPWQDRAGNFLGYLGMHTDITEPKQAEEALRISEDKFSKAFRNSPNAITITRLSDGKVIEGNESAYELFGYSHDEVIGKTTAELNIWANPDDRQILVKGLASKGFIKNGEFVLQKKDKSPMYVNLSASLITLDNQKCFLSSFIDITDRKKAEEALRKAKDELELRVHERTKELSQANKKLETVNVNLIEEIKGHTKARAELQTAKEVLEITNEKLQSEIAEHKQTEEQLLEAKEAAEAATKAKAEFLANMSHEIRTPMNSVIGFTELLLDDSSDPLSPEQKDNLEHIRINGHALLTIINDILDFSKMESGRLILEDQPFNLRQCVEESLDLVALKASEKGLNLSYAADKNVPDTIIGDPGRLRQVLGNLLSNAVKFTDKGEVTVSASSQQINGANGVRFAVQDTGIGISQGGMHQLFQMFNQMEPSTTRLYGGTGLGLAISKKLVELMGGQIWAESKESIGSTFHFTIKASSDQSRPEHAAISSQMIGKCVLIVEDNKTNRRILSKQIYDWGMVPMAVSSGQEALRYIQRGDHFDIALLDLDLKDMDSLELEEKIRKYNKDLPLILLTSLGKRIPPNHACLIKPIKQSQLHRALKEVLPRANISQKESARSQITASEVGQTIQSSPLKILLAEDNVSSQMVALKMLKKLGYRADVVANGIEVLQSLERQHYDMVLMDLKMPEMDGLEATRIIRQRWPENGPKIIAITAYALQGDKEKCLAAGMDGYIAKPVQIEDLAKVLNRYQQSKNS